MNASNCRAPRFPTALRLASGLGLLLPVLCIAGIESVAVFPDRATVTRVVSAVVETGSGTITLSDLPANLDADSLRIMIDGPNGARIANFGLEPVRGDERVVERARDLERQIEQLQTRRETIEDAVNARNLQMQMLESLAKTDSSERPPDPAVWLDTLDRLGETADEILADRRGHTRQMQEVDREIQQLQRRLSDLGERRTDTTRLALDYVSEAPGSADLTVEYTVDGASWEPVYEWRLDTRNEQIELIQHALVRQNTGEDWTDVALSVSLSRPAAGGKLPELSPWWVDVIEDMPRDAAAARPAASPEAMMEADAQPTPEATLVGTEFTQAYRISDAVSLASDNQPERFQLASHDLETKLEARTVPSRQTEAWVFAEAEYGDGPALSPGRAALYQDGTFVGRIDFDGLTPGATLETSFGVDPRIGVEHELIDDSRGDRGIVRRSVEHHRTYRIRISNGHDFSMPVTVLDHMPVARDERIEVELTGDTDTPDHKDFEDRPGILAWELSLDPGEERELTVGYQISHPRNIEGVRGW